MLGINKICDKVFPNFKGVDGIENTSNKTEIEENKACVVRL